jgi:hypothetical protein
MATQLLAASLSAQTCSGFPWTVTAHQSGSQSVSVHICGTGVGCLPSDPRFTVVAGQITVFLTGAQLPDCICGQPQYDFGQTFNVSPVSSGDYAITAIMVNCGQPTTLGTGSVTVDAASAVPTLGPLGAIALTALLGLTALWRVRH